MYIIDITYTKPLTVINAHLDAHRAFLSEGYKNKHFVASGPKIPRIGGIILANFPDIKSCQEYIALDPFYRHDLANYNITEFTPTPR